LTIDGQLLENLRFNASNAAALTGFQAVTLPGPGHGRRLSLALNLSNHSMLGRDIYIAIFVLFAGVIGLGVSYPRLVLQERPQTPLSDIRLGEYSYALVAAGRCVGSFSRSLSIEDQYEFDWEAELRVSYRGNVSRYSSDGFGGFNSLGQLVGVVVNIRGEETQIVIGLEEVNPIRLTVRGQIGQRSIDIIRSLPGPVELFEIGDQMVRVQYRDSTLPSFMGQQIAQQPLLDNMNFEFLEISGQSDPGCADQEAALSLDYLIEPMQRLLSVVQ